MPDSVVIFEPAPNVKDGTDRINNPASNEKNDAVCRCDSDKWFPGEYDEPADDDV